LSQVAITAKDALPIVTRIIEAGLTLDGHTYELIGNAGELTARRASLAKTVLLHHEIMRRLMTNKTRRWSLCQNQLSVIRSM
jgi:hypothetical protein